MPGEVQAIKDRWAEAMQVVDEDNTGASNQAEPNADGEPEQVL